MADQEMEASQAGEFEVTIGDRVMITEKNLTGEVVGVREFDGRKTFVIDTEKGSRVVVGQRQVQKL